ncbi:MAG: O-methyltransferase, partial [Ignavibacteriae bacterium]
GPALHTLPDMISEQSPDGVPFIDVVFIDADKQNYRRYLDMLYPYVRTGGLIIGDNALAWGHVHEGRPDFEPDNVSALRAFNDVMSSHPGLQSTLVPLGDGMVIGLKTA